MPFTEKNAGGYTVLTKRGKRSIGLVVGLVALLVLTMFTQLVAHPLRKTPADQIAVSYGGGPFEGAKYQGTTQPGSGLHFNGFFDRWYEYPTTVRNYIVSLNANEGDRNKADEITAPTKDGVSVQWEIAVYFKLNTNLIRDFHERLGLKYHAWNDKGWDKLLDQTFRQQLENAMQVSSKQFTADEVYKDPAVIQRVQADVASGLKDAINQSVGAPYFCGPTFAIGHDACPDFQVVVKKPNLPKTVVDAFNNQKSSAAQIVVAQNNASADVETAKGKAAQQQAVQASLTPAYLDYLGKLAMQSCASNEHGTCTLVITQSPGDVNVNTGK